MWSVFAKMKKLKVWHLTVFAFIFFSLTDFITTFLGTSKHGVEYEGNVIYALTGSFTFFMFFKLFLTLFILYTLIKTYLKIPQAFLRYFFIYVVCILIVLLAYVSFNNYQVYQLDSEEVPRPLTKAEKVELYKEQVMTGQSIDPTVAAKATNDSTGLGTFIFNMIQFLVWRSFEKRRVVKCQK
jgi:magnesium-transporting ATPase (P-type)